MSYHYDPVVEALFPSRGRRAVLEAVFGPGSGPISKSELARRHGMTQRAISLEVDALERAGLVRVEVVGSAHVVVARDAQPGVSALRALLAAGPRGPGSIEPPPSTRAALAALGAPLPVEPAPPPGDPERVLVEALGASHGDAEVLRVLPAVVVRQAERLDWTRLVELARAGRRKGELGLVLDVAASIAPLPWLRDLAEPLLDGRRRVLRPLPDLAGEAEAALAGRHPSPLAERWGFRVNLREEDFRAALAQAPAPGERPGAGRGAVEEALRALDTGGAAPGELTLLADAALALRHGSAPALPRLETWPALRPEARTSLSTVLARHPWLGPLEGGGEAPPAPLNWTARRTSLQVAGVSRVRLLVPEPHDWAILLAGRALATDLDSVEAHHRREPLRLLVLVSRYLEAVGGSQEAERRLRPGFHALVERLFGAAALERVRAGVPPEGPGPGEPAAPSPPRDARG